MLAEEPPGAPPIGGGDAATDMRRIAGEYLRLPWTDRVDVARSLGVLEDHDLHLPDTELFPLVLRRVRASDLVGPLIEELRRV